MTKAMILFSLEATVRPYIDIDWFERPEFKEGNLLVKHGIIMLVAFGSRWKYFGAFKFGQAGIDSMGMSFNGSNGKFDLYSTSNYWYELEKNTLVQT
jgi:hypothetical protein